MTTSFEIIAKDWYKRRRPNDKVAIPISVNIPDFQPIKNHICNMEVHYDDGTSKTLIARVIYNQLNDYWTVDGMEVAVKVING